MKLTGMGFHASSHFAADLTYVVTIQTSVGEASTDPVTLRLQRMSYYTLYHVKNLYQDTPALRNLGLWAGLCIHLESLIDVLP